MPTLSLHRVLLAVIPALLIGAVVVSAIWGDNGLLARYQLQVELESNQAELAALDRENQRLLRELSLIERDPVVVERILADELHWGREGAVLYRFDDEPTEPPAQ